MDFARREDGMANWGYDNNDVPLVNKTPFQRLTYLFRSTSGSFLFALILWISVPASLTTIAEKSTIPPGLTVVRVEDFDRLQKSLNTAMEAYADLNAALPGIISQLKGFESLNSAQVAALTQTLLRTQQKLNYTLDKLREINNSVQEMKTSGADNPTSFTLFSEAEAATKNFSLSDKQKQQVFNQTVLEIVVGIVGLVLLCSIAVVCFSSNEHRIASAERVVLALSTLLIGLAGGLFGVSQIS
jgi:uncharacterized coiled-coil protein SlyX